MAKIFKQILDLVVHASKGKFNKGKSHTYGWNTYIFLRSIDRILEFPYTSNWTTFKYVRMPISLEFPKLTHSLNILKNIKN